MRAYSRAALAQLRAASSVSSVSSPAKGAESAMTMGAAERPVDVASAALAFASLLLEGLSKPRLRGLRSTRAAASPR
jgi:hypothetical protein